MQDISEWKDAVNFTMNLINSFIESSARSQRHFLREKKNPSPIIAPHTYAFPQLHCIAIEIGQHETQTDLTRGSTYILTKGT